MMIRNTCLDKQWCLSAAIVAVLVGAAAPVSAADSIELISVGPDGPADDTSSGGAISSSGRFVAFDSWASNLVAGDNNGWRDVFVRDRISATTERVSLGLGGVEGNSASSQADISGDGRFVVFFSSSSNLVPGDTNGFPDVFVRDRKTGTTERVSIGSGGAQGNGYSGAAQISADGRFVAFQSDASNLVPHDTNGVFDVFVRDRQKGTTRRVSLGPDGRQSNGYSGSAQISADGRFVAFHSGASNLVNRDTNDAEDIFVRNLQDGLTERVNVGPGDTQSNNHSYRPAISADGRFIAFASKATNLVLRDTNETNDIFVRDRQQGTTRRVSVGSNGRQSNGPSSSPKISAKGHFVAFESDANNLVRGENEDLTDIYLRDRPTRSTLLVTPPSDDDYDSVTLEDLSAHGTFVVFNTFQISEPLYYSIVFVRTLEP